MRPIQLTAEHPIIKNHVAYGNKLLPGLAWIDFLYQWCLEKDLFYKNLELRNLTIYRPFIVENGQIINLDVEAVKKENFWELTVTAAQKDRLGRYITAIVQEVPAVTFNHQVDIDYIIKNKKPLITLTDIYQRFRSANLKHSGMMIAKGSVIDDGDYIWNQINVTNKEVHKNTDFLFHPALLDASGLSALATLGGFKEEGSSLFLPVFFQTFRAAEAFTETCYSRISKKDFSRKEEIITMTIDFFNQDGKKIAELINLKSKRVRNNNLDIVASSDKMAKSTISSITTADSLKSFICSLIAFKVNMPLSVVDTSAGYYELGLNSMILMEIVTALEEYLSTSLPPTLLFEYTNIDTLISYLEKNYKLPSRNKTEKSFKIPTHAQLSSVTTIKKELNKDIAIIGMAGRYPMAKNLREFWQNLVEGRDCITLVPHSRWDSDSFKEFKSPAGRPISQWGGFIDDVDCFDARFFRVSPKEAENLDPQERLFLEICWETIEDAGYTPLNIIPNNTDGRRQVGVFVGVMHKDYALLQAEAVSDHALIPLSLNYAPIANRVSYFCDFHGPSLAVDTVCSSSLTAVHLAIESIRKGECKVALAGGVNLSLHPYKYLTYGMMEMHSSDGRCRAFGEGGDGYVSAEGIGALLLKPLDKALEDGDNIYAVIKGSSINHGGTVSGFTVPSPIGQAELIADCLRKTHINPETINYIEAHGTGTSLGDPIEVEGLKKAFTQFTQKKQFCALGSVKSNIGHAESAAGISGLTKCILQLHYCTLVKSLHAQVINPYLDLENSPFYLQSKTSEWKKRANDCPRRAGVSSFGASGSNAHVILEEAPERQTVLDRKPFYLITLSAKTEEALQQNQQKLLEWLLVREKEKQLHEIQLSSISYTLNVGRGHFNYRGIWVASDVNNLKELLTMSINSQPNDNYLIAKAPNDKTEQQESDKQTLIETLKNLNTLIKDDKIYKKSLLNIGQFYLRRYAIDWENLHSGETKRRISLPTYAFAKERYWVETKKIKPVLTNKDIFTFEESWQELMTEPVGQAIKLRTLICFLSNTQHQQLLNKIIKNLSPETKIIFISWGDGYQKLNSQHYLISASNIDSYQKCFQDIKLNYHGIDGIWYAWALEEKKFIEDPSAIVLMLQAISAAQLSPVRLLLAGVYEQRLERCYLESWIGFERSLRQIFPQSQLAVIIQQVKSSPSADEKKHWFSQLWKEFTAENLQNILYQQKRRYALQIQAVTLENSIDPEVPVRPAGTCLITGGLGGLGYLFACHLAQTQKTNLILTGRSRLNTEKKAQLQKLTNFGSLVYYLQADVSDLAEMKRGLKLATEKLGRINSAIHAAGIESESTILNKDLQSFHEVLSAKIKGSIILDQLLASEPLQWICYFSSSSAILGDLGSCDYAIANRFEMAYTDYRNSLYKQKKVPGRSIVINWPLWREGGMGQTDEDQKQFYLKTSGQRLLETQEGLKLFAEILQQPHHYQYLILAGQHQRINQFLSLPSFAKPQQRIEEFYPIFIEDLKTQVRDILKIPANDYLDEEANLGDFGFDSISLAEFARQLTSKYHTEITPSLFFGHSTLSKLANYLLTERKVFVDQFYQEKVATRSIDIADVNPGHAEPIAIIGLSGRFPGANDVEQFWQNIADGINSIIEVPKNRWSLSPEAIEYGGFLDNIDQFDPLFFDISPHEAECMDPRQRLFLEEAWHAFEDAGYMGDRIRGKNCGVYVGVEEGEYDDLLGDQGYINSTQNATIAARIAYNLDLKGPNLVLTSACSSGLVALRQACLALNQQDCEMALVGGIHLLMSPKGYVKLNRAGMLSPKPEYYIFDERASGLIPGEAVAVVLLKSLAKAIVDKDHIYGCITASGVNYDGKTNGITAPNLLSQAELIEQTYTRYHINPENIQYVISHSVGSHLGDPVEFEALTTSFRSFTEKQNYCTLGSIKPLIGHTFAASGIVNLITMLLAMKNEIIPGTFRYENTNRYIHLQKSPFMINSENQKWLTINNLPKTGVISSTGISGTNAHVVIESYHENLTNANQSFEEAPKDYLIVFSASAPEQLAIMVKNIIGFLESKNDVSLLNLAYTLQVGREAMAERLAIIVFSIPDLLQKLKDGQFTAKGNIDNLNKEPLKTSLINDEMGRAIRTRNLNSLADLWVKGVSIPWRSLPENDQARIIALPTYPFAHRRCWINTQTSPQQEQGTGVSGLYTLMAKEVSDNFQEEYLTFCPFLEKIPGFSMTRVLINPKQYPEEIQLIKSKQIEMRQVLFCRENFPEIKMVLDIGCGYGTDVIQIAELYPHIQTHGFTITPRQAEIGNKRIAQKNVGSRTTIFCRDSTQANYPCLYDLVIGVEVTCHIHNKESLFQNISTALKDGGRLLLADFIANLKGPIVDANVAISISTQQGWAEILTKNQLRIDELIDISPQIANLQYDPDYQDNIKDLPKIVRDSYQNYANNAIALEKGLVSYCLFKISKVNNFNTQALQRHNVNKISHQTSYVEALRNMHKQGYIPYPKNLTEIKPIDVKQIKKVLIDIFIRVLKFDPQEVQGITSLQKLGISSLNAVEILEQINTQFNLNLPSSVIFEYSNIENLANFLQTCQPEKSFANAEDINKGIAATAQSIKFPCSDNIKDPIDSIVIIGIACRCAGANNSDQLWDMVKQGRDCISTITNPEWTEFFKTNSSKPVPCRYGQMAGTEFFDPLFFNISPKEAALIDPTQRIILEESFKSLEDAGYAPSQLKGQAVGTFIGVMSSNTPIQDLSHYSMLGAETSILAARLAYFLDLKGPALAINTACSSSLVALDIACQQLRNYDIDLAIAGGITIYNQPELFVAINNAGMLSPTGQCRPFDNNADGIVLGDGVGVVVLKRLADAQRDGDHIYALIKGSGINQDGQTSGITVPSFLSQSQLEESIHRKYHIDVEDINYIEAHGTATKLGDPIEIHALTHSFKQKTEKKRFCAIGSLKANIGHTTAAAGILSVIKVLLSLKHRQIAPLIHFNKQNEHIDFDNSPFFVNTTLREWQTNSKGSRLAAVSSFGFSGTNAHVIIEEGLRRQIVHDSKPYYLICLSAKTTEAYDEQRRNLLSWLEDENNAEELLSSISFTLNVGRDHYGYRGVWIVSDKADLKDQLQSSLQGNASEQYFTGILGKNQILEDEAIYEKMLEDTLEKLRGGAVENRAWYYKNLRTLGNLYVKGYSIDWNLLYPDGERQRISLPTYSFAKERYYAPVGSGVSRKTAEVLLLGFYQPVWEESQLLELQPASWGHVLMFTEDAQQLEELEKRLWVNDPRVKIIQVQSGENYRIVNGQRYQVRVGNKEDYQQLFKDLNQAYPQVQWRWIVNAWSEAEPSFNFTKGVDHLLILSQILLAEKLREVRLLHFYRYREDRLEIEEMNAGFVRSLREEHRQYVYQVIGVGESEWSVENLAEIMRKEWSGGGESHIHYRNSKRWVTRIKETELIENGGVELREKGIYLITGGMGGLGLIFAEYLAKNYRARLVLTGRSKLDTRRQEQIKRLEDYGAEVIYIAGDISCRDDVHQLLEQVNSRFGDLNGIIHAAGMLKDSVITKKTIAEMQAVLKPKIDGTIYLEEFTRANVNLEYFILFSSGSAVMGNAGQCDYAAANAFLDHFAHYWNRLAAQGKRPGRAISINWPLWAEGGMQVNNAAKEVLFNNFGMSLLSTETGIRIFNDILKSGQSQIMPLFGDQKQFKQKLWTSAVNRIESRKINPEDQQGLREAVQGKMKGWVSEISNLEKSRLRVEDNLDQYGFDSIAFTELSTHVNNYYQSTVTPALFYQYPNIKEITGYLLENARAEVLLKHGSSTLNNEAEGLPEIKNHPARHSPRHSHSSTEGVAIVGMAGVFPGANDINDLWNRLLNEQDAISHFPEDRAELKAAQHWINWGGFIQDIDKFDADFFSISPREAELMDPQQRIFLMAVCRAIEDAGYAIEGFSGQSCSLFAGVQLQEYGKLIEQQEDYDSYTGTGNSHSILVNRVSYLLNLQGTSEAIDTACSSSLVALHRAVQSIETGESNLAIAGGVNGLLSASSFIGCAKAGMLSADGRCKTFDKSANGYVRGEGVGVLVLKPLSQAQLDGDHIYGVIKGSAVNHGGHVNTLTAPNPNAQAEVIKAAYRKAQVSPESISYIEAHGTGTSLGDPIEINGLKKAFTDLAKERGSELGRNYCGIGSVKTNIGHLETAAGITGVIKVLLCLREGKLPASIHCQEVNPYIELEGSPFYLVRQQREWERLRDVQGRELPRRAGISSFGFGGSNAHVMIEESPKHQIIKDNRPYYLVSLSGKTKEVYDERQRDLLNWLRDIRHAQESLSSISYTLNAGRGHYGYRGAWIVKDKADLEEQLQLSLEGKSGEQYFTGILTKNQKLEDDAIYEKVLEDTLEKLRRGGSADQLLYYKNLRALANLYAKGYSINWNLLYPENERQRVSLPNYPFIKQRYWANLLNLTKKLPQFFLHPLISNNLSTLSEQCYEIFLDKTGELSSLVYIEIARAAGTLATAGKQIDFIKNIRWSPLPINNLPQALIIGLYPKDSELVFEIRNKNDQSSEPLVYSQGYIGTATFWGKNESGESVHSIMIRCKNELEGWQGLRLGEDELIAQLQLPPLSSSETERKAYQLHPAHLDTAIQMVFKLTSINYDNQVLQPFSLDYVQIFQSIPDCCYVHIAASKEKSKNTYDIVFISEEGQVYARLQGFQFFTVKSTSFLAAEPDNTSALLTVVQNKVTQLVAEVSKQEIAKIILNENLINYGFDSITFTELTKSLNYFYQLTLKPTIFYERTTILAITEYLLENFVVVVAEKHQKIIKPARNQDNTVSSSPLSLKSYATGNQPQFRTGKSLSPEGIAVIGMAGILPGANDVNSFWANLINSHDAISHFPEDRLELNPAKPWINWGGFIKNIDKFDAEFFNIFPREAELMDPQQRIFLMTVCKAIEDAGYAIEDFNETLTSLFVGVGTQDYFELLIRAEKIEGYTLTGMAHNMLPNRVSFLLGLKGTSEAIDTACSSSLVALHRAVQSLETGESDLAIAGGVNGLLSASSFIGCAKAGMLSADGRCKTFDKSANGYVRGEGVGVLVLKPLSKAQLDGDHIYGVIKGSAVNHGGHVNTLTAPNPNAQAEVIKVAYRKAQVIPESISYIEAHGTGTSLGDPIEINGLKKAFTDLAKERGSELGRNYCGIGSVKTNIGHLETAAGIAGVIKVLLCLREGILPASIHCQEVNPYIELEGSPFYLVRQQREWERLRDVQGRELPRRAGISSFGFGGSNAHVIIEESPSRHIISDSKPYYLISLSAKTKEAYEERQRDLLHWLESENQLQEPLSVISYTLNTGRGHYAYRGAWIVRDKADLEEQLRLSLEGKSSEQCFAGILSKNQKLEDDAIYERVLEDTLENLRRDSAENRLLYYKNLRVLANLYAKGYSIDWNLLYPEDERQRISLPSYPFAQERYWPPLEPKIKPKTVEENDREEMTLGFYQPVWEESQLPELQPASWGHVLMFTEDAQQLEELEKRWRVDDPSIKIIQVQSGENYCIVNEQRYQVRAGNKADYQQLFKDLNQAYPQVQWRSIVNAWSETEPNFNFNKGIDHLLILSQVLLAEKLKEVHLLHFYQYREDRLQIEEMNAGFVRSLREEHPQYVYQVIGVEESEWNVENLAEIMRKEWSGEGEPHIHYRNSKRWVTRIKETELVENGGVELRKKGIYLITGGMGGLGQIFAEYLAKNYQARLVLTGRSKLDARCQEQIKRLEDYGAEVIYIAGDISCREDVRQLLEQVKGRFGDLNGVIHAAGLPSKSFVREEVPETIKNLAAAKIHGCFYLEEFIQEFNLEFIAVFSSISVYLMNSSLVAYSSANAFLDHFTNYWNCLAEKGKRPGRAIGINWPLWANGGMQVDEAAKKILFATYGMGLLSTEEGVKVFAGVLRSGRTQIMPVYGNQKRFKQKLWPFKFKKVQKEAAPQDEQTLFSAVQDKVKEFASEVSKLEKSKIRIEDNLDQYGFDSIAFTELSNQLNNYYQSMLTPALFYQYPSIREITGYLLTNDRAEILAKHGSEAGTLEEVILEGEARGNWRQAAAPVLASIVRSSEGVAVIGMAGVFPGAANVEQLWENLINAYDAVTQIPTNRLELQNLIGTVNWGGFIDDIDKFDPQFFNISPREAELMDPQQRIFLQIVYKSIEDAGYALDAFSGKRCGLFAGIQHQEYAKLIEASGELDGYISTGNSHSMLVNRISYLLNLTGPSEAIDTACSSSLVAIHRAVQSIELGESDLAIAGGVNGLLSSGSFLACATAGMLSPEGRCKTFDKSANGYVRGEGVGAIVLKPLSRAKADGDHIYGVIKGSAVNHGGHVNTLTAPNPNAQAELIKMACVKAGITPDAISYIEAHGTGTKLGDPIEINGLKKAFSELAHQNQKTLKEHYCGIGSIKSNIGHLEAAAGIAGVIKVLLAMQYQQLPANLHCHELNPYINLNQTPFYIVTQAQTWARLKDQNNQEIPRIAGISSFGFGGANAHIILEEVSNVYALNNHKPYYLLTLSAKTKDALWQQQRDLLNWMKKIDSTEIPLESISYTLNTGRNHYLHRIVWIVKDSSNLIEQLEFSLQDKKTEFVYSGMVDSDLQSNDRIIYEKVLADIYQQLKAGIFHDRSKYFQVLQTLADLYVKGYDPDWNVIHLGETKQRISLPSYPFAKESFWIPRKEVLVNIDKYLNQWEDTIKNNLMVDLNEIRDILSVDVIRSLNEVMINRIHKILFIEKPLDKNGPQFTHIRKVVKEKLMEVLKIKSIDENQPFQNYGLDSISIMKFVSSLEKHFQREIDPQWLIDFSTLNSFSEYLENQNLLIQV